MPSAQKVSAAVQRLIPFPVHLTYAVDEPIKVIPHSTAGDKCAWWLEVLRHDRNYSPENGFVYEESKEAYKLRLAARDVILRLTKDSGTLRVYGTDRLEWFKGEMLPVVVDPITARMDEHLGLQKYRKLMQKLSTGGSVAESPNFIYPLWKAQLDRWFNLGMPTYIVTPSMDAARLRDILILMCKHVLRRSNFTVKLIIKDWCNIRTAEKTKDGTLNNDSLLIHSGCFGESRNYALNMIRESKCVDGNTLDDAVKRLKVVSDLRFRASFVCAYKDTNAEVLVTSASFDKSHFETPVRDTVAFHKITKHELKKDYLISFLSPNEQ